MAIPQGAGVGGGRKKKKPTKKKPTKPARRRTSARRPRARRVVPPTPEEEKAGLRYETPTYAPPPLPERPARPLPTPLPRLPAGGESMFFWPQGRIGFEPGIIAARPPAGRAPGLASPPATKPPPWYRRALFEQSLPTEARGRYAPPPGLYRPEAYRETPEQRKARLKREARMRRVGWTGPGTGAIWGVPEAAETLRRFFWPTTEEEYRQKALRQRAILEAGFRPYVEGLRGLLPTIQAWERYLHRLIGGRGRGGAW